MELGEQITRAGHRVAKGDEGQCMGGVSPSRSVKVESGERPVPWNHGIKFGGIATPRSKLEGHCLPAFRASSKDLLHYKNRPPGLSFGVVCE